MRLFIAVNLSPQQQKEVDLLQQRLKKDLQGIKGVPRENLHLTLKFIGEVPEEKLDAIVQGMQESLAGGKPFPLQLGGMGVFPSVERARVLWLGVNQGAASLAECARRLEKALACRGVSMEQRPYRPHLTLGRMRRPPAAEEIAGVLERERDFRTAETMVESIVLYQSLLFKTGAVYRCLQEIYYPGNAGN
ncbi:MAG: RNA 2',3'-cyclic phosphodiesterase [Dethiobacteria bacterium]